MQKKHQIAVKKITTLGVMSALSIALAFFVHIPFPPAPFLEYDPADIPIFIVSFIFGPWWGIGITVAVSLLQGLTVSASSGIYGILMHVFATSAFVIVSGLIYKRNKTFWGSVIALSLGCLSQALIMIPLNLIFTPLFMGSPVDAVLEMILPIILPFNLMKAGINAVVTGLLFKHLEVVAKKFILN